MQSKLFLSLALLAVASASLYANQKYITVNQDGSYCQIVSENGLKIDLIKNKHVASQGLKTFEVVLQGPGFYKTFHINNQIGGDVVFDLCARYQGVVDDLTFEKILYKIEEYVQQGDLHPKVFYMFKCLFNKEACEHLINDEVNGDDYYFGLYGKTFQGPYTGFYGKKFYEHKHGLFGDNYYGKQYYPYNMDNVFYKTRMPYGERYYGMNKYDNEVEQEVEYEQEKELEQQLENQMTTNFYGQRYPYVQGQISKYSPYFQKTIAFNKFWTPKHYYGMNKYWSPKHYSGMNKYHGMESPIEKEIEYEQEREIEQEQENGLTSKYYGQRFPYFQGQFTKSYSQGFPFFQKSFALNKSWSPRNQRFYGMENPIEKEFEYEQEKEIEQELENGVTTKYYGHRFPYFQGQFTKSYGQGFPHFQKSFALNKFWAPRNQQFWGPQGYYGGYYKSY